VRWVDHAKEPAFHRQRPKLRRLSPATTATAEIAVIIDRSGSMQAIATDAIGGFNAFVAAQRLVPGAARMTLILFDDRYEVPIKSRPLGQVPMLTRQTFVPRGSTALLDAIGRTIKKMTESFAARPAAHRPDTIIAVILTDGEENASRTNRRHPYSKSAGARQRKMGVCDSNLRRRLPGGFLHQRS